MQIYVVGIGQCGTSVTYDVISNLVGTVKSKEVTSSREGKGGSEARNELLSLLIRDMGSYEKLLVKIRWWAERIWGDSHGNRVFIPPRLAIIDGNTDNFVKSAFEQFRGILNSKEDESDDQDLDPDNQDLRHFANLILSTQVLDLNAWRGGCANGIVGEQVSSTNLPPNRLRNELGIDGDGKLENGEPVDVFLVVSSGGGATGSGGGVYLGRGGAIVEGTRNTLVLNALVLPSTTMSADNRRYALNAGRALARHGNTVSLKHASEDNKVNDMPSSIVLFSNPRDEGSSPSLQRLNDYIAELTIRMSNFSYSENAARIGRDLDVRQFRNFMFGNASVLAMGHVESKFWDAESVEHLLVESAFVDMYDEVNDEMDKDIKPHGLSIEREMDIPKGSTAVLDTVDSAMVVVGVPPRFKGDLSLVRIASHLRESTGSSLDSGIEMYAYGSASDLELTVFLRYESMNDCSLAHYFIKQFVGDEWNYGAEEILETTYLRSRVERRDKYTAAFREIVADLAELGGSFDFDAFVVQRQDSLFPRARSLRSEGNAEGAAGR